MKTIMVYDVEGKRFDDPQEALYYEKLCEKVLKIMSELTPRTRDVENGEGYIIHNVEILRRCYKRFCEVCAQTIPSYADWFSQAAEGVRHISHIGRILSDHGNDYPILWREFYRFNCSCFDSGYEFQQPYYVTHQDEFFAYMEKLKEE